MKKLFILIIATFIAITSNAQMLNVTINGNGTYEQYVDTVLVPIDSCTFIGIIDVVYDTTTTLDTVYNFVDNSILAINTTTCISKTHTFDTIYLDYDTVYANMITAVPDSGWEFANWVIIHVENGMVIIDSVFDDTFCIDWVDSISVFELNFYNGNVGITDNSGCQNIKIYPNPTTNIFNVEGDFDYLMIYNIKGKLIYKGTLSCFDLQRCPSGMYPVVVVKNKQPYTIRVVKQ